MEVVKTYSYRHAEAIISSAFPDEMKGILEIIDTVKWQLLPEPKVRRRKGRVVAEMTFNQAETNVVFEKEFVDRGWDYHPYIVSKSESKLVADFKKNTVQVEVQFGNMARWYTDVFKFLLSYAADDIEVGVLIVAMQEVSKEIDENVVYFERIVRELPHAKMAITIPVWVIGVGK